MQDDALCEQIHREFEQDLIRESWLDGDLSYKLWPQQIPIYNQIRSLPSDVDEAVVLCARQFGKSHLGVLLAVEDCLRYDDICILIIGPTLKQTREIVAPRLRRIMRDAPAGLIRPSKSEGKWYIGTSELVIGGMDVNSSAQRGKTVQTVYIEEIVESKEDDYLEALRSDIGPALTHSHHGKIIYLTTLPKVPDHPFITDTMARAEINGTLYRYTIDDNKALTPEQYDACVRRSGGKHTDDFRREYLCEVIRDRSIVIIPDFERSLFVGQLNVPKIITLELFTDWGGVRDLTVSLLMGYDFLSAWDLVIDEMVFPANTPTEVVVKAWVERWGDLTIKTHYVDAPGQTLVDLRSETLTKFYKNKHMPDLRGIPDKDWEAQINNMANRFTQRKIKIAEECKLLAQTCQSGTFNKNRTDFERTIALGHMDAAAALMYGIRHLDRTSPFKPVEMGGDMYVPTTPKVEVIPRKNFMPTSIKRFGK